MVKIKIINRFNPDKINKNYKYVIYRKVDNENWFHGADNDLNICMEIVSDLGPQAKLVDTCDCNLMAF